MLFINLKMFHFELFIDFEDVRFRVVYRLWRCSISSCSYTLKMFHFELFIHFEDVLFRVVYTLWRCSISSCLYTLKMFDLELFIDFEDVRFRVVYRLWRCSISSCSYTLKMFYFELFINFEDVRFRVVYTLWRCSMHWNKYSKVEHHHEIICWIVRTRPEVWLIQQHFTGPPAGSSTTCDQMLPSVSWEQPFQAGELTQRDVTPTKQKGLSLYNVPMWGFPEIGVPPNHPF